MNDDDFSKALFRLMQNYFVGIGHSGPASDVKFDDGSVVHISESAHRAMVTHQTAHDAANEWLSARLADEGLEFVGDG